jgi:hypothetical protein
MIRTHNHDPDSSHPGLAPRAFAALWFAIAALCPVGFVFLTIFSNQIAIRGFNFSLIWLFGLMPISAASFIGFTVGSRLVDSKRQVTSGRAALRGIFVALLSYLLYTTTYLWLSRLSFLTESAYLGSFTERDRYDFGNDLGLLLIGFILFGWLVAGIGALAGKLLRDVVNSCPVLGRAPGAPVGKVRAWVAFVGTIYILANTACLIVATG